MTVGGASANSYATLVETDAHALETVWSVTWAAKTDAEKDQLLVRSTRALDGMRLSGRPASDTQALQSPRTEQYKPSGTMWSTTAIAAPLKTAQMHIAAWLSKFATTADPFIPSAKSNVKRSKLDVLETEYFQSSRPEGDTFLVDTIEPMLEPWGLLGVAGVTLVR